MGQMYSQSMPQEAPAADLPGDETARPLIRFDAVSVIFASQAGQKITALHDFNLGVRAGEILALVGPSGCGKSTALRLVSGLLAPTLGRVHIEGGPRRRGFEEVAIVFQRPTLLPWFNVLQNVLYPVRMLGRRITPADRERARELLAMVGLADRGLLMPDELSGGMQQRAAICRSLILDAKILLMDEPFGALDALTREELQIDLLRLHHATGKTILLVTHSISEAVLVANRVAVMAANPGRLKDMIEIDLPSPRDQLTQSQPMFARYAQQIRDGIFSRRNQGMES
jgi:NitT/TauT family transport system ATP-binding protein